MGRSGGYGDRRQRGNKKFRRKIVREINVLAQEKYKQACKVK